MQCRGAKSFVDDLGLSRGVVLSRAAASLRSIETKPFDWEICPLQTDIYLPDESKGLGSAGRGQAAVCTVHGTAHGGPCPLVGGSLLSSLLLFLVWFFISFLLIFTQVMGEEHMCSGLTASMT